MPWDGAVAAQLLEDAAFTIRIELPGDVEGLWGTKTSIRRIREARR